MSGCRGPRWLEADIDMESSTIANHVVALVKGVTTSQTIDMAVVLQVSPASLLPLLAPLPTSLLNTPASFLPLRAPLPPHFSTPHLCQPTLTVCWRWLCGLFLMQHRTEPACLLAPAPNQLQLASAWHPGSIRDPPCRLS